MPRAAGTCREEAGWVTLPPDLDSSWNLSVGWLIFSGERVGLRYQRGRDEPLGTLVGQSCAVSLSMSSLHSSFLGLSITLCLGYGPSTTCNGGTKQKPWRLEVAQLIKFLLYKHQSEDTPRTNRVRILGTWCRGSRHRNFGPA